MSFAALAEQGTEMANQLRIHANRGGGGVKAAKVLTHAEQITVRRMHARGHTVVGLARIYKVSDGQISRCIK